MTNKELMTTLMERINSAKKHTSDEQNYEEYCYMIDQDDCDDVYGVALNVICRLLVNQDIPD